MTEEEFEEFIKPEIEKVIQDMIAAGELEAGHEGMENEEGAKEPDEEDEDIDDDVNDNDEDIDDEDIDINELLAEDEVDEDISLSMSSNYRDWETDRKSVV